MLFRAARGQAAPPGGATPQEVGPGSYDAENRSVLHHAGAPFNTGASRCLEAARGGAAAQAAAAACAGASSGTAEPPALDRPSNSYGQQVAAAQGSAAFKSGLPRFGAERGGAFPGGAKCAQRQGLPAAHRVEQLPPAGTGASLPDGLSAPSIPDRRCCWGYEGTSAGGHWQAHPPPSPASAAAVGAARTLADTGGTSSGGGGGCGAPSWSASRTERLAAFSTSPERAATPGPGAYDPGCGATCSGGASGSCPTAQQPQQMGRRMHPLRSLSPEAHSTSSFATKVRRGFQKGLAPGSPSAAPGSYSTGGGSKQQQPVPAHLQAFSRASARASNAAGLFGGAASGSGSSTSPGPGAYLLARAVPPGVAVAAHPCGVDQPPFGAGTQRFAPGDTDTPGPGVYSPEQAGSLAYAVGGRLHSRRGAFGSAANRFASGGSVIPAGAAMLGSCQRSGATSPGPGQYSPPLLASDSSDGGGIGTLSSGAACAFASRTERFRPATTPASCPDLAAWDGQGVPPGSPERLGPGCYPLQDLWAKPPATAAATLRRRAGAFGSSSARLAAQLGAQHAAVPGPGEYYPAGASCTGPAQAAAPAEAAPLPMGPAFCSEARFRAPASCVPGPGSYDLAQELEPPSFNVSWGVRRRRDDGGGAAAVAPPPP